MKFTHKVTGNTSDNHIIYHQFKIGEKVKRVGEICINEEGIRQIIKSDDVEKLNRKIRRV